MAPLTCNTPLTPYFCPNRRHQKPYSQQRLNAFSTEHLTKFGGLFPSGGNQCQELNQSYSEADSYIDVINHNIKKICPHGNTVEEFGKAHQKCVKNQFGEDVFNQNQKHERMCIKFNQRPLQKRYERRFVIKPEIIWGGSLLRILHLSSFHIFSSSFWSVLGVIRLVST